MEDCEVLEKIRSEDMSGLKEVYTRYHDEFIGLVFKKFPRLEREDAEDIYADTVISLVENIQTGRITCESLTSTLKTYMFQIGINKTLARLKRETRFGNIQQEILRTTDEAEEFDNLHEDQELVYKSIQKSLTEMGDPCKSLLEFHYFGKRRMNDIADLLGYKNADVAKNQKAKCMKRLRKMFNQE
jgi:RNA polymerase sigma factor (sigma-70 family)